MDLAHSGATCLRDLAPGLDDQTCLDASRLQSTVHPCNRLVEPSRRRYTLAEVSPRRTSGGIRFHRHEGVTTALEQRRRGVLYCVVGDREVPTIPPWHSLRGQDRSQSLNVALDGQELGEQAFAMESTLARVRLRRHPPARRKAPTLGRSLALTASAVSSCPYGALLGGSFLFAVLVVTLPPG